MLSEKIKELRKKKGLTQEELANSLNVSRQAITKWESGEGTPDIDNLKNIALFFHVSVDYLVDSKTEKTLEKGHKTKGIYQLKATVLPSNSTNNKVVWKSSNPKAVSVDQNGKVTAVGYGTKTVTADRSHSLENDNLYSISILLISRYC